MSPAGVRWSEGADRDLRRLDPTNQRRVVDVIRRFAQAREGEVKRLQGPLGSEFRLRSGNLRIRFLIDPDGTIVILRGYEELERTDVVGSPSPHPSPGGRGRSSGVTC